MPNRISSPFRLQMSTFVGKKYCYLSPCITYQMELSQKLIDYVHSGNGMAMGTRDASMVPEFQRVLGARVVDGNHILFFFDGPTARHTIRNLEQHPLFSVTTCSNTFESYQFKGTAIRWAEATDEENEMVKQYLKKFNDAMIVFGLRDRLVYNYPHTKMMTVMMEVTDVFEQTPKTGTGQKV